MSLRVWLPLTKDLRNQGLDDVTVTNNGATFDANGKLGGCYLFDGSNDYLTGTYEAEAEISFAAWVNLPTLPGGRHIFDARTSNGTGYQPMYLNNNSIQIGCSGSSFSSFNYTWVANTWYHICVTHNATEGKCYINGILIGTSTTAKGAKCGTCNFTLGSRCNQSNYSNVKLNDIRIYDHALSPLEVKQISQGLILHYPLNRNGWGQENLATNTTFDNSTVIGYHGHKAIEYNHSDWVSGGRFFAGYANSKLSFTEIEANQPYTISAWVYIYDDVTLSNPGGTSVFYRIYKTGDSPTYGYDIAFTLSGITERNKWVKISSTFTSPYTYTYNQGGTFQIGGYNGHFLVSLPKVEKGAVTTPWCPNSADALATTMGLNSITEYDCSGFCNNGIRTGTFSWDSNTAKYSVSTKFNGTDNAIQTPSLPTMITDKNYTIAVWIYKTVIGSKGYQTIYGGPSGFEIEARNGSTNETKFVPWNWGKPMASYELNEWNHCVFVHSDSDCKIYLNGEYIATGTAKASNPSGNYFVGAWNTATQQNFDGLMSDFRIYATALSADDVKSLYQNSAYIDNQGNIYGAVYEEV